MTFTPSENENIFREAAEFYISNSSATLKSTCEKFDIRQTTFVKYMNKNGFKKEVVRPSKYSQELVDKLVEEYAQDDTKSFRKLGEPYGIPYTVLSSRAKELGIKVSNGVKTPLDPEKLQLAIQYYQNGLGYEEAAKKAGIGANRFRYYMRDNGLLRKSYKCQTDKTFDIDYFKTIDTEEKAYWLGFILADGYITKQIHKNRNNYVTYKFGIELQESDANHLEKFNKSINGNIIIKHRQRERFGITYRTARIEITNTQFCLNLMDKGIIPNKSIEGGFNYKFETTELKAAFLRGVIDGDGSIRKKTTDYEVKIAVKSTEIMKYFTDIIYEISGVIPKTIFEKNHIGSSYKMFISNKIDFFKLMDIVYKDATIYMNRKYQKYVEKFGGRPQPSDIED